MEELTGKFWSTISRCWVFVEDDSFKEDHLRVRFEGGDWFETRSHQVLELVQARWWQREGE